jgi:hypothetical protein
MKDVQAGGVMGGKIDSSPPETPDLISLARFGMLPSAIQGRMTVQVAASNPTITTFGTFFNLVGRLVVMTVFAKFTQGVGS